MFYSMAGSIPAHINSIAIPIVENQTAEFGMSESVTENLIANSMKKIYSGLRSGGGTDQRDVLKTQASRKGAHPQFQLDRCGPTAIWGYGKWK
jgi:hypothetical protein